MLAVKSLNLVLEPDSYIADVLISHLHLQADRILRIFKRQIQQSGQKLFNKIIVPTNMESAHWYLAVLQRDESGDYKLTIQNTARG